MKRSSRRGFTIIELLAAMAVLMIIVALMSRVFATASSTWRSGNKRAESNNTGRSAIDFMATELAGLLVSPSGPTMKLQSDVDDLLGMKSDRLTFVSMNHTAEYRSDKFRDVQQIHYAVALNPEGGLSLYRWVTEDWDSNYFTSYESTSWYTAMDNQPPTAFNCAVIADNVRNFEVFITPVGAVDPQEDYDAAVHGMPATIDIYLEVLAEDDAVRATLIPNNNAFLNAATRRYATRIYVQNRSGYASE